MIQQESCFLAHLRNWCAHQEVVYIIYIYIQYTHQFAWICPNTTLNTFILPLSDLQLDLQIILRSFHLSPKKEHQNAKFWKQLSLSLSTYIYTYYIYICVYLFIYVYIFDIFIPSLMTPHPTIVLPLILPFTHLNTIISQAWEQAAVVLRGWFCINSTTPR